MLSPVEAGVRKLDFKCTWLLQGQLTPRRSDFGSTPAACGAQVASKEHGILSDTLRSLLEVVRSRAETGLHLVADCPHIRIGLAAYAIDVATRRVHKQCRSLR